MPFPIDTHAHLYASQFDQDRAAMLIRAKEGLSAVLLPNIDQESVEGMLQLAEEYPGFCFPMMGLHPCHVEENWEAQLEALRKLLDAEPARYVAIGETGLDLYWDKSTIDRQRAALRIQIGWAKELGLPIVLHARDAIDETADEIEAALDSSLSGIFHCFDGTIAQAERIMGMGSFRMGIGGILTYRKDVQEVVRQIPPEYLVLETDSPYLPPDPHRKDKPRRNESSYLRYVCAKLAELKGMTEAEVAAATNANVLRSFPRLQGVLA